MKLGFLLQGGWRDPGSAAYGTLIDVARAAEDLGADTIWLSQHHFDSERRRISSPLIALAAVAAATRRIGLGTGTVVLPYEGPLRLAEDASTLDVISAGRLQLGVGSGFGLAADERSTRIDERFGVPPGRRLEAAEAVFDAVVDELLAARTAPPGRGSLSVEPSSPGLADRIWRATSDPAAAAKAGRRGAGLLVSSNVRTVLGDTARTQLPLIEAYLRESAQPRVAVLRNVLISGDAHAAEQRLAQTHSARIDALIESGAAARGLDAASYLRRLSIHYGCPEAVAESLRSEVTRPHTTELIILCSSDDGDGIVETIQQLKFALDR